jgi:hypothetical protein
MRNRLLDPRPRDGIPLRTRLALGVAVMGLFAGCAPVESQTPPPKEPPVTVVNLQFVTEKALADATRLTGLERAKLEVVEAADVTWRDGSLGCPQEGMQYTMALVPGYRVRIQAGDRLLDYHASSRGGLSLCPEGRAVDPLPGDSRI